MPRPVKRRRVCVGVDPGVDGGLACLGLDGHIVSVVEMPTTPRDIWDWFISVQDEQPKVSGILEKVHAMPKQGVSSTFKFGTSYGSLFMALTCANVSFMEVTPQTWIKGLGIPSRKKTETPTRWKNRLKGKAQQLFPNLKITLATADALLIAEYCRRQILQGNL